MEKRFSSDEDAPAETDDDEPMERRFSCEEDAPAETDDDEPTESRSFCEDDAPAETDDHTDGGRLTVSRVSSDSFDPADGDASSETSIASEGSL